MAEPESTEKLIWLCITRVCCGKVYVIGGENIDEKCLNSIECLDLSVSPHQWITTIDQGLLQTARHIICMCVTTGTQIFILGGYGDVNTKLMSVEILDAKKLTSLFLNLMFHNMNTLQLRQQ
jgi:hypothetical protein